MLAEDLGGRADEGRHAARRFVQDDSQRVDVGGGGRRMDIEDLRRHVQRRANGSGGLGGGHRAADAGHAEVGQARDPRGDGLPGGRLGRGARGIDDVDEDVGRLDIAVHDAGAVHHRQPFGQERPDPGDLGGRHGAPCLQKPAHVPTADVVHDDGGAVPLDHHVLHTDDIGGAHSHQGGALAHEALNDPGILKKIDAQEFHREVDRGAVDAASQPDLALSAGADEGGQDIGAAEATGFSGAGRTGGGHAGSTRVGASRLRGQTYSVVTRV